MADLIRFDDRYASTTEYRLLHRNWLAEEKDEASHNAAEGTRRRPWAKSQSIRSLGLAEWNFPSRREIRYFDHQPIVKGVLFFRQGESQPAAALLTFQYWQALPPDGGSEFKGTRQSSILLRDDSPEAQDVLKYLDSQFEYEWARGRTAEDLRRREQRRRSDS